jgi:ABC-type antimicrobial peptide transport system permease subunit
VYGVVLGEFEQRNFIAVHDWGSLAKDAVIVHSSTLPVWGQLQVFQVSRGNTGIPLIQVNMQYSSYRSNVFCETVDFLLVEKLHKSM